MADFTITVSLSGSTVSCSPDSLNVNASGTIYWQRKSGESWNFTSLTLDGPNPSNPNVAIGSPNVNNSVITASNTDNLPSNSNVNPTYAYTVCVNSGGTTYCSDPQIIEKPVD